MESEILTLYPPNYDLIISLIPDVANDKHAIFSYKRKIYNPYNEDLTPDRELHEKVHFKQQGNDSEGWYYKYLTNREFRLEQELIAYSYQYAFVKKQFNLVENKVRQDDKTIRARKAIEWGLDKMAEALSSKTYGKLLSYGEAQSKIRNYSKNINDDFKL